MALPEFSMRQLLEAGAHFGHQTHRWNPKMERYIFGSRSNIHIIDLSQSIPLLHQALVKVREVATGRTKKELLQLTRERDKLELSLGGIKDMGGIPDLMFVIDTNKEAIAIQEARKLNIPVIAILDTNCNPDGITYPIPGNDDAARAIQLYCDLMADSVLDGLAAGQSAAGVDLGASEAPIEPTLARELSPQAPAEAAEPAVGPEVTEAEMTGADQGGEAAAEQPSEEQAG